jgi:DNA-binding MurR/RpiR family transcriptional regulator
LERAVSGRLVGPVFAELEAKVATLPRKQQLLARTILEAPEFVAFGSVRDLSARLGVNNATVIRFAKSLGFNGYQELQAAVRETYLARAGLRANRATQANGTSDPLTDAFTQHLANLEIARRELAESGLDQVTDTLVNAERIVVCATGSAVVPGQLLVRLLRHAGHHAELVASGGVDRVIALHDLTERDVVVVIGLWLTFREAVQALAQARTRGARSIAIVGSATSPLGRAADHTLLAPAQSAWLTFSVVATIAVIEAVVSSIAARNPERRAEVERMLHDLYVEEDLLAPAFPPHLEK